MATVGEATGAPTLMGSVLQEGLETLSIQQTVTFVPYIRTVLPIDGYVFWVKASLLLGTQPKPVTVKGSVHYASSSQQDETENYTRNSVVFTAEAPVNELNTVNPQVLWLGGIDEIRFAFSQRRSFYNQADLWHYAGDAVYPALETQIIDESGQIPDPAVQIISNSLPIWLTLNSVVTAYPAFLVPDNIVPPYAAVEIPTNGTEALQSLFSTDPTLSQYQLCSDRVKITLYGLSNSQAMAYYNEVIQYLTLHDNVMGLMSDFPVIRDGKRKQNEMNVLAQQKFIEFKVSYYQQAIRDVARRYILNATPTFTVSRTPV